MIDAHAHVWRLARGDYDWLTPELGALHRDHELPELLRQMAGAGVGACVLVQAAATHAETRWLCELADACPHVVGVVGWLDLRAADPVEPIGHPRLVGLRAMPDAWAGTALDDSAFDAAFGALAASGLAYDALVEPEDLDGLLRRVGRTPGLRVVVDHGGNPEALDDSWLDAMARLGAVGAWVKLSGWPGLPLFAHAPGEVARASGRLFAAFPRRVLWGSDWPVVTQACSYGEWHRAALDGAGLDKARVFGGAATEVYRLGARA